MKGVALGPEAQRAYYPAGILIVDRDSLVETFAASGALIQSRIAVVSVGGEPRHVVDWLVAGARAGHSAPVGYLHDASTVLYPFFFEPLATLARSPGLRYRDLGLRPGVVYDLESVDPARLISYAVRSVLEMIEPDARLAPRKGAR